MRGTWILMQLHRERRVYGRKGAAFAFALLVPLLAAFAAGLWWIDRWSLGLTFDAYADVRRIAANAAAGLTMFALLAALTRRMLLSLLLIACGCGLFYMASAIKLELLGLPMMLSDFHFLTSLDASSLRLFLGYVDFTPATVGAGGAVLVTSLALFVLEPCWCTPRAWSRLAVLVISASLLVSLHQAGWPWMSAWYGREAMRPSPLSTLPAALHGGLVSSLVHYNGQRRHQRLDVDTAALRRGLRRLEGLAATGDDAPERNAGVRPDVVIVLSESFMDPRVLKGMNGPPDLIPNMRTALGAKRGGWMLPPTFGGGTVRTEFEVLTGMPVAAFPDAYYPYVDLSFDVMPGVVSDLKRRGYASFALHGNSGSFWNRASTYRAMGVDRFITQGKMLEKGAERDGGWVSDRSMTDILLEELGSASGPTVAIAISIEAHGPYDMEAEVRDMPALQAIRVPDGLDAAAAAQLRKYLYHLHNADRELGRLLDGLRARARPFVLLFFGDHLPAFNGVYEQLGFADGGSEQQQPVPWLLESSDPGMSVPSAAHAWELPALLLRASGGNDGGWFGFVRRTGEQLRSDVAEDDRDILVRSLNAGANARLAGKFEDFLR